MILAIVHSPIMRALAKPVVITVAFLMGWCGLDSTPDFDWLMSAMWGHNLMFIHFVASGMLCFWNIFGVDPSPRVSSKRRVRIDPAVVQIFEIVDTGHRPIG